MTIYAYCDWKGCEAKQIDADFPAGCRVLIGKGEVAFHLCPKHQAELRVLVEGNLATFRPVK